jgi:ribonuclease-3
MAARKSGKFGSGRRRSATAASSTRSADTAPAPAKPKRGAAHFGHRFKNEALIKRALTHASAGGADNEQLEFLGDRVLGFLVAELLIKHFPEENEGALALKLNALVRMETCARVAEAAGVGKALILAPSEDRAGGRRKAAILGDACEAVIAALYLDGGIEAARKFVAKHWQPLMSEVVGDLRDPKNALQEWAQGRRLGTPSYRIAKREGPDHAPRFTVEVCVPGQEPASGEGASLRAAEQAAARALMKRVAA